MTESPNNELAPFYYRDNFLRLCDTVQAQYEDVLSSEEHDTLKAFRNLEFQAQCLYVRLVSRVGPWFRESKLQYTELGQITPILDTLLTQGMAHEAQSLCAFELGKLFTREELQQAFFLWGQACAHDKATLLCAIEELKLTGQDIMQALTGIDRKRIVAPTGVDLTEKLQLLFFGNQRQSITDFVLQDLGITRYYPYTLDRQYRLFSNRDAVEEYLRCAAWSENYYALLEAGDWERLPALATQMCDIHIRFPSSEKRWHRLCNSVARDLERIDQHRAALQLYEKSLRHPARERRARIQENLGNLNGTVQLCEMILADPWCEEEREAAARILSRARRKLDGSRQRRPRDVFTAVTLSIPAGNGAVEDQVAGHLANHWQAVHYVENKLMNTLFGLAFWEQIFATVPGAFHNPFQSVPADMYDSGFRLARRTALTSRLDELRKSSLVDALNTAYQRYQNYQCRWVDWRRITAELVDNCTRTIPAEHLLAIWERMLFDPGENRRGFPDLIALGTGPGDYCMIEVKGPGDALQDNQKRWLRFFQTQGIPAQVAWVEWRVD
ncbi:MAG: VRR-NUC domain-containing protein [Halioglobus sp.]